MPTSSNSKPNVLDVTQGGWPRWLRRGPLEMLASLIIGLGLFMLLQPFALVFYTWSFVTMLAGTVMFMVVSKFPD
jgi:hypothetical protein